MFFALREMRHARLRTGIIVAIITLIAWLVYLLSGLANGLASDNGASVRHMNVEGLVLEADVRMYLHRSILPGAMVQEIGAIEGTTATTPLGHLTVTVMSDTGTDRVDATILGIDPSGFLAPKTTSGVALADAPAGGVVVDDEFRRSGYNVGDLLTVTPSGEKMTIVGFTTDQKYNHLPVIFMAIDEWRALKFKSPDEAGGVKDPISAVAVQGNPDALDRIRQEIPGVEVGSKQDVIEALPGYSSEMSTVSTILFFLFFIAALVMAAFFYIITLQKTHQFGVLKAIGARTRTLALDLIAQVTILAIIVAIVGALLANMMAAIIPSEVPFALSNQLVIVYGVVLVVVAIVGALFSALRITRIDPLVAIGRTE